MRSSSIAPARHARSSPDIRLWLPGHVTAAGARHHTESIGRTPSPQHIQRSPRRHTRTHHGPGDLHTTNFIIRCPVAPAEDRLPTRFGYRVGPQPYAAARRRHPLQKKAVSQRTATAVSLPYRPTSRKAPHETIEQRCILWAHFRTSKQAQAAVRQPPHRDSQRQFAKRCRTVKYVPARVK